ncbi:unnamed protein product [Rotaria magnacalcarata]
MNRIICTDDDPAVSPDLNLIAYVWAWTNNYVQQRHSRSQWLLERLVTEVWNESFQRVMRGCIDNIHDVCPQIIANQCRQSSE